MLTVPDLVLIADKRPIWRSEKFFRGLQGRKPWPRALHEEKQTMSNSMKFYIDGAWVDPADPKPFDVIKTTGGII